ncbi:hypothetical protein QEJ31_11730 [Pigmentibacter sp. JX0631]|uniref:tetratricopeptide repeat protein n=1 Tax=Pigmentibacter sp. JX0631 TaxID=2976982 RepID=UPI0024690B36|nr:hypothetical protein [Pigmentibacter sp. JX0631]WGL59191.1 hypothetical protein QEJ31_11730 [Pigmentibacter sp. JX0631]
MKRQFFTNSITAVLSIAVSLCHNAISYAQNSKLKKESEKKVTNVGEDSYRLVFELNDPRRYATRYDKLTRTLQIKIIPARANEFNSTAFYDTRFVKRILIKEEKSEVIISIQLKNMPIGWVIATQNKPWRILIDFWRTELEEKDLEADWNWQPDFIEGLSKEIAQELMLPKVENKETINSKPSISSTVAVSAEEKKDLKIEKNSSENPPIPNLPMKNKYGFPEIYGRLEKFIPMTATKSGQLQMQMGAAFGTRDEIDIGKKLAEEFYKSGNEEQSLSIFRRLAALSEKSIKSDARLLWYAGESAYLTKNFSIANDYLRSIILNYPGSYYSSLAKLRIIDIDELTNSKEKGFGVTRYQNAQIYSEMAITENSPSIVKYAATLRVLNGVVDKNPSAAKTYQQNLDACVTDNSVPFDLMKNCAYDRTRALIEIEPINSSDAAVQQFKKLSAGDKRSVELEKIVFNRVKELLKKTAQTKQWEDWIAFERKARPSLLEFTFADGEALFTRAEAFEAVGENLKSAQLYTAFWQASNDQKKKNEAAAIAARLLYRSNKPVEADDLLRRIELDTKRKTEGLTDRSVTALRELSVAPYRNKIALRLLLDEMKLGRYVERDLPTLSEWAQRLRGTADAEPLYAKILAYPAKSMDETQTVETSIMQYAEDLREAGRFANAGDMFLAVANLAQGTHRAEAAYKAGVVYARVGLFEKAKTAWLLAANDTNDKRFSSLASERLDRLSK